ncbi:MAG: bifunctional (p)ppGpp synthetase/guanosine-3',5'-bis(diphosphate) 3'-pyrophosphohydrolase [Deltaproteobacteria bacterium]|nr:MAG: bifunctional (p)ppGpp synthetase/guanosine-3',5'-bis(diphosphate) 3'-pyrophosphohydrolase [Deltaproteobacteria bacterium]
MRDADQRRLIDALALALAAHGDQTRKGTEIPYASHLLSVAGLVLEAGGDADQAVAALLHDALEDGEGVDEARLRAAFGAEVAAIVVACSDLLPGDTRERKSPWGDRKRRYLAQLAAAGPRVRLVAACDKLHNLRTLIADLRSEGPASLERFTASPEQTRWYHESAHALLRDALPAAIRSEFDSLIEALRGFVARAEEP